MKIGNNTYAIVGASVNFPLNLFLAFLARADLNTFNPSYKVAATAMPTQDANNPETQFDPVSTKWNQYHVEEKI